MPDQREGLASARAQAGCERVEVLLIASASSGKEKAGQTAEGKTSRGGFQRRWDAIITVERREVNRLWKCRRIARQC